jgi:hypothetical protein
MFEFQGAYIQHLVDATDYPNFDIAAVNDTFLHWKHDKAENIMGYRDKSYRSLMTGTQSPPPHPVAACPGRLHGGVPGRAADAHQVGRLTREPMMNAPRVSHPREPGLFARAPALERYRVAAGGVTLVACSPATACR